MFSMRSLFCIRCDLIIKRKLGKLAEPASSRNVGSIQRLEISTMYFPVSEPCEKTYCAWGATCVASEDGKALCQCPPDCPLTLDPVCGSDDMTYANYCHLRQASCQKRKNTRVKHQGACGECLLLFFTRVSGKMNRGGNQRELRIWHRNDYDGFIQDEYKASAFCSTDILLMTCEKNANLFRSIGDNPRGPSANIVAHYTFSILPATKTKTNDA